jgi:shikimate kinase
VNKHKRIFIVGHPGAGKGLVAKLLAEKLGWQFINSDLGLESCIGRTLAEIVGKQGEEAFHHCESEILSYQLTKDNIVVATDASIVSSEKNRQLLSSEFVVYLKVSTSVQLERALSYPAPAPLLPMTDHKAFLDKLHQERDALYDQAASFSISTDDSALEEHVLSIVKAIGK